MRLHAIKLARAGAQDFSDLTTAKLKGEPAWVADSPDVLDMPFDREPTDAEKIRIRRRLMTPDRATEDRVTAWANNRAALKAMKNLPPPDRVFAEILISLLDDKLAPYGE